MGCGQSKIEIEIEIENKESVCRCRDSLHCLKQVITARKAFAFALSDYAMTLKNTGSALTEYAQGGADEFPPPPPPPPPILFLPPPPPLPFLPTLEEDEGEEEEEDREQVLNVGRMATVDETPSPMAPPPPLPFLPTLEEDEEEEEEEEEEDREHVLNGGRMATLDETPSPMAPPPPPPQFDSWDYFFSTDDMSRTDLNEEEDDGNDYIDEEEEEEVNGGGGVMVVGSSRVNLLKILGDIDDHFLKASESAREVSKMLEVTRLQYHSNFADNRGHIDHAARVMRVITLNRSFKAENGSGEYDEHKYETHATVLDKLVAREKKLYQQVKADERIKLQYQRKAALLSKLKHYSASTKSIEKAKAAMSHLHTRYIVDMESLDSTVSEVYDIRDNQLFPKLVALVDGMSKMWESMCEHHDNQLAIVSYLKSLDVSRAPKETTEHRRRRTVQLLFVVQEWHSHFETLVTHQEHYVQALDNWLKLNLIPIKSSLKEKISSPPRIQTPPVQTLLHSRHDHLQKLPGELAKGAISSFSAVIGTILIHQEEEMKLKDKWEDTRKEYLRKKLAFEDWYQKYTMKRGPQEETGVMDKDTKDPIAERQFVVESLKKRFEDEMEAHQKLCVQVRDKSLGSLKFWLPEIFRAMSDYARVCRDSYQQLRLIMHSQNHKNGS